MQKNNNIKANKNIEHLLHLSNAPIDKRHNTQPKKTHTNNSNISKNKMEIFNILKIQMSKEHKHIPFAFLVTRLQGCDI